MQGRRRVWRGALLLAALSGLIGLAIASLQHAASPTLPPTPPTHRVVLWDHANLGQYYAPRPAPLQRPGGGLVIVAEGAPNGRITLLQAYDPGGRVAWSQATTSTITALVGTASPARYILGAADPDAAVYALDDAGHLLWRTGLDATVLALAVLADGQVAARLAGDEGVLLGADGRVVWRHTFDRLLAGPELLGGGLIAWGTQPDRVTALRAGDGSVAWAQPPAGRTLVGLAARADTLLVTLDDGLLAREPQHGAERWRWTGGHLERFGPILTTGDSIYVLVGLTNNTPALTLYRLNMDGLEQGRTALSGRLAEAHLYPAAEGGVIVQTARTFTHVSACGAATPITLAGESVLDAFLPMGDRTYIATDDRLSAVDGSRWGQPCP